MDITTQYEVLAIDGTVDEAILIDNWWEREFRVNRGYGYSDAHSRAQVNRGLPGQIRHLDLAKALRSAKAQRADRQRAARLDDSRRRMTVAVENATARRVVSTLEMDGVVVGATTAPHPLSNEREGVYVPEEYREVRETLSRDGEGR